MLIRVVHDVERPDAVRGGAVEGRKRRRVGAGRRGCGEAVRWCIISRAERALKNRGQLRQCRGGGVIEGEVQVGNAVAAACIGHQHDLLARRADEQHVHIRRPSMAEAVEPHRHFVHQARDVSHGDVVGVGGSRAETGHRDGAGNVDERPVAEGAGHAQINRERHSSRRPIDVLQLQRRSDRLHLCRREGERHGLRRATGQVRVNLRSTRARYPAGHQQGGRDVRARHVADVPDREVHRHRLQRVHRVVRRLVTLHDQRVARRDERAEIIVDDRHGERGDGPDRGLPSHTGEQDPELLRAFRKEIVDERNGERLLVFANG